MLPSIYDRGRVFVFFALNRQKVRYGVFIPPPILLRIKFFTPTLLENKLIYIIYMAPKKNRIMYFKTLRKIEKILHLPD